MFFDSGFDLLRIVAVGVPAYAMLVVILRLSGKRTLSKMNAFDLVITVAMGSTLSAVFVSPEVSLSEGVLALLLLVLLQFSITWTSLRSSGFRRLIKSEPTLLFYGGRFPDDALTRERVTPDEVLGAARAEGIGHLSSVHAVVLETNGTITAVRAAETGRHSTLEGLRGAREVG